MVFALFSLGLTLLMMLLSVVFKLAGKLRLTLPLIYFLLICTVLNPWAAAHERLALGILAILLLLSVLSWVHSLHEKLQERRYYKAVEEDMAWQIGEARKRGIDLSLVYFDSQGNMRYRANDQMVI